MVKHIQYLLVSHSNMNKLLTHILYLKAQKPPLIEKDLSTSTPGKKMMQHIFQQSFLSLSSSESEKLQWFKFLLKYWWSCPCWKSPRSPLIRDGLLKFRVLIGCSCPPGLWAQSPQGGHAANEHISLSRSGPNAAFSAKRREAEEWCRCQWQSRGWESPVFYAGWFAGWDCW